MSPTRYHSLLPGVFRQLFPALLPPVPVSVRLQIDWQRLGIDPRAASLKALAIERFQPSRSFAVTDPVPVEPGKGWLLVLESWR